MPFSSIRCSTTPGSSWPGRVPIGRPSSAVKPIVLSMLRPSRERAHRGAAAEVGDDDAARRRSRARPRGGARRCTRSSGRGSRSGGCPRRRARAAGRSSRRGGRGRGGRRCRSRRPAARPARSPSRAGSARGCSAGAAAPASGSAASRSSTACVDQDRPVELRAAVNDAVADGAELEALERCEPGAGLGDGRRAGQAPRPARSCGRRAPRPRRRRRAGAAGRRCRRSGREPAARGRRPATRRSGT